ncbi:HlyD family type I secretion periplasmic adaptor subunit [Polymorphobacter glacialis]|uniref:Membrane fusion protein (MFP) family protein n=2 Tax=Sandarakinorhabdus glacialis TaxID=1614636 RepID=A0A916ZVX4_9SPHN|nr:HlyD family type I secretion periplasmic adaptor subunit [Polymorphobacter glacialis]
MPELPGAFIAPARVARLMLWSIAGFSGLMIAWAGLARVNETAVATGRVVPARQLQIISNLEGGVVEAILVRPGQKVAAGEILMRLDPGAANSEFGRSNAAAHALRARIARLEAEASGRALRFESGPETAALAAERALFSAHRAEIAAASAGDAARLDGARRALAEAGAQRGSHAEARAQAAREAAMYAPLVDKGIEPAISLDRARSVLAQAQAAEDAADAGYRRAAASVAEASAALRAGEGRLRSQAGEMLAQARAELAGQAATLPALETRLARTALRSPVAGTVQRVLAATVGGSVAPGVPLVEVVPAGDRLVVEAQVRPADIAFVHLGQKAAVRLTAYDASVYGALAGRVERISPDAVVNERTGESHYAVRVASDSVALRAPDGMALPVGAGMTAEIDLIGRKRSVLSYLLSPVTKLRDNAFRER